MRHIGFTGTRHGMTDAQLTSVARMLYAETFDVVFHHGDCIGADAEAHTIALRNAHKVHVHPPADRQYRAYVTGASQWYVPKEYLARNRDIVDLSDEMIATPAETTEQQRGGTWSTIRYARKAGKPLAIVWPDGRVTYERWP